MPDYMFLLESRLSPEQRAVLLRVQELAQAQEANVYLTGGAVRDLLSGMPLRDLDFALEGNPARMVHELEKGGARLVSEDERIRHYELILAGDVDGSVAAARDEHYDRPGAKPEIRWSTVMEDLRRRDFSVNAVAISLNPASRGLLLDPTNGLADLERREIRALSIHAFTNQPVWLLRCLRYCTRLGFKMEQRTSDWFALAIERGLHESLDGAAVGREVFALGREDNPAAILKSWEARGLLGAIHQQLPRRRPYYEGMNRIAKARESLQAAGARVRLVVPVIHYLLRRLKSREAAAALRRLELPSGAVSDVLHLIPEAKKAVASLRGRKTNSPRDAYQFLSTMRPDLMAFVQAEFPNPRAMSKIRNYLHKWRPLRQNLPVRELDALGVPRGPQFDQILENLFELQLRGKGRTPPERTKYLRKLAGIKEEAKQRPSKKAKKQVRAGKAPPAPGKKAAGPPAGAGEAVPAPPPAPPVVGALAKRKPEARPKKEARTPRRPSKNRTAKRARRRVRR